MRRKPLWYYGIMCLVLAALPTVALGPPADPAGRLSRMTLMAIFSVIGFGLIGWSAYGNWRNRQNP